MAQCIAIWVSHFAETRWLYDCQICLRTCICAWPLHPRNVVFPGHSRLCYKTNGISGSMLPKNWPHLAVFCCCGSFSAGFGNFGNERSVGTFGPLSGSKCPKWPKAAQDGGDGPHMPQNYPKYSSFWLKTAENFWFFDKKKSKGDPKSPKMFFLGGFLKSTNRHHQFNCRQPGGGEQFPAIPRMHKGRGCFFTYFIPKNMPIFVDFGKNWCFVRACVCVFDCNSIGKWLHLEAFCIRTTIFLGTNFLFVNFFCDYRNFRPQISFIFLEAVCFQNYKKSWFLYFGKKNANHNSKNPPMLQNEGFLWVPPASRNTYIKCIIFF